MTSFKRVLQVLPLLSIVGLASCFGSAVTNLLITSVDITPANPTIATGATQQFMLSATYVDGTTDHESPDSTAWFSDNAAVATINRMGVATAIGAGTAHIKGSFKGNNTTTLLTVTAAANVVSAVQGDSRLLNVTNLRTGQLMTFAADSMRDSVTISRSGNSRVTGGGTIETRAEAERAIAGDREASVLPEHGPAWLAIDPAAKYLYVVNHTSETVSVFAINWKTGALTAVPFSPFSAGAKPWSVAVDPDGSSISVNHFQTAEVSRFRVDPATGALKPFGEN
jgi:Lactonase, 7-bladed beta-propeller/Bacterial Ig-like domain (group 2)